MMSFRVILSDLEIEVIQGERMTFRQIGKEGFGIEGVIWWEDIEADLMAALEELQKSVQVQGKHILELIPAEEFGNATPFTKEEVIPPHGCEPGD